MPRMLRTLGEHKEQILNQATAIFAAICQECLEHCGADCKTERKRGRPAGNAQSDGTKMGHKMALVHHRLSLLDRSSRYMDDDSEPTDEELAIVVPLQSKAVDGCDDPDDGVGDYAPLRIERPDRMENGQEQYPGSRYKTSLGITKTYERKRWGPADSKSAKRNEEQKPELFDSSSSLSGSKSDKDYEPSDEDGSFEPSDPDGDFEPSDRDNDFKLTRKRRSARTKSAKTKKPRLVYSSSSSSEGKKDKDADFEREVCDIDGRKKYARFKDFYGPAWDRAVKVTKILPAEGPSFVMHMLKSHVVQGFWLSLPASFCRNYLPERDANIFLEDEDGKSYETKYLLRKEALSSGWRGFAVCKELKVGDAVVFQLVETTTFKVYILRENKFSVTDGALSLLGLNTSMDNDISASKDDIKSKEDPEVTAGLISKPCDSDNNDLASEEAADGDSVRSSDRDTAFTAVKSFSDFKIIVDGLAINRRLLPEHVHKTYYKLCCERKAFLHSNLLKGINPTLAAGVIVEMVNIANGIRACTPSASSLEYLAAWKTTLDSFELLGMDVAFMRERVEDLLALLTAQSTSRDLHIDAEECEGYEKVKRQAAQCRRVPLRR